MGRINSKKRNTINIVQCSKREDSFNFIDFFSFYLVGKKADDKKEFSRENSKLRHKSRITAR